MLIGTIYIMNNYEIYYIITKLLVLLKYIRFKKGVTDIIFFIE